MSELQTDVLEFLADMEFNTFQEFQIDLNKSLLTIDKGQQQQAAETPVPPAAPAVEADKKAAYLQKIHQKKVEEYNKQQSKGKYLDVVDVSDVDEATGSSQNTANSQQQQQQQSGLNPISSFLICKGDTPKERPPSNTRKATSRFGGPIARGGDRSRENRGDRRQKLL